MNKYGIKWNEEKTQTYQYFSKLPEWISNWKWIVLKIRFYPRTATTALLLISCCLILLGCRILLAIHQWMLYQIFDCRGCVRIHRLQEEDTFEMQRNELQFEDDQKSIWRSHLVPRISWRKFLREIKSFIKWKKLSCKTKEKGLFSNFPWHGSSFRWKNQPMEKLKQVALGCDNIKMHLK